jgi:hypothetical protein
VLGLFGTIKAMMFGRYGSESAMQALEDEKSKPHGPEAHLVQLGLDVDALKQAKRTPQRAETANTA